MIQYIPYRWVEFVQIYLNRHTIPVKLNKTWKQVKERKGEKGKKPQKPQKKQKQQKQQKNN